MGHCIRNNNCQVFAMLKEYIILEMLESVL